MFGSKGDIQLMSLAVVRDHCSVEVRSTSDNTDDELVFLIAGKGQF